MRTVKQRSIGRLVAVRDGSEAAAAVFHDAPHSSAAADEVSTLMSAPRRNSNNSNSSGSASHEDFADTAALHPNSGEALDDDAPPVDPLTKALADDAPLTLAARDDPRIVARQPLRFHELLPTLDQQLQYRHRQAAHQTAIDVPPAVEYAALSCSSADGTSQQQQRRDGCVSAFVQQRLPLAVGRVRACKTALLHAAAAEREGSSDHPAAAVSEVLIAEEDQSTLAEEQRRYREQSAEQVLRYLLEADEEGIAEDGGAELAKQDPRRQATITACLSGLREVPSSSMEYTELLQRLVRAAEQQQLQASSSASAAANSGANTDSSGNAEDMIVDLPAYAKQLLVGVPSATKLARNGTATSDATRDPTLLVGCEERQPVVTSSLRATLDAVLPPRFFIYYLVNYEAAVAAQQQRRAAHERQRAIHQALRDHPEDLQSRAELEQLATLLAGPFANAPIGVSLVVLERTSDVQAPREYLRAMEQSTDAILKHAHARCCGRPLSIAACTHNAQRRSSSLATALPPIPPAEAKRRGNGKALSTLKARDAAAAAASTAKKDGGLGTTTTILTTPEEPVCTRTLKPPPAHPAALSSSGGGSASVAATLNVRELNAQRRLVQLDLLGEELLRQVTVDLPERGVLLRRLLDEAQLSLEARAVLARERTWATQEHLLDGQDAREAAATTAQRLEAEVAELRERLTSLKTRRSAIVSWIEEHKSREMQELRHRKQFEARLRERLVTHTEAMKAAQEAERRGSLV